MLRPRKKRSDAAAKHRFAADRNCVEGGAVEGIPHRYGLEATRGDAGQFQSHTDGYCAGWREKNLLEPIRRELHESPCQFHRRSIGVASR